MSNSLLHQLIRQLVIEALEDKEALDEFSGAGGGGMSVGGSLGAGSGHMGSPVMMIDKSNKVKKNKKQKKLIHKK